MGRRPVAARPRAVPLPAPRRPLRGAQRIRHPRRAGARRPRPARPRPAALRRRPRQRRRRHRHRRQDHAQRHLCRHPPAAGRDPRRQRRRQARRRQDRREPVPGPHPRRRRPAQRRHPHPKKVDRLPLGADDETQRTNEIGTVVPMLERLELDFAGKTFTADALLTQRKLADFLRARPIAARAGLFSAAKRQNRSSRGGRSAKCRRDERILIRSPSRGFGPSPRRENQVLWVVRQPAVGVYRVARLGVVSGNRKFPISGNRKLHTSWFEGRCRADHPVGQSNRDGVARGCTDGRRGCG